MTPHTKKGVADADATFKGAVITGIHFLTEAELENLGWEQGTFVIAVRLKNGEEHALFASQDDEGNGPGALFTTHPKHQTLWVDTP